MIACATGWAARREHGESLAERWGRRALTIPLYISLAGATVALLPLLLLLALVSDLIRRMPMVGVRCVLFLALYLSCEALGLLAAFGLRVAAAVAPARFLGWNWTLQAMWARTLFKGAVRVFGLCVEVEGDTAVGDGPLLVFVRHASVADTLLPAVFVAGRHGLRLRYVMKRELLWDPCLDVVGQRLPNFFVRRGSTDAAREVAQIARLAEDIGRGEGVLIYPEGTRFTPATPAKRARALAGLQSALERFARAAALQHVLPPRLGGPQALLEAHPDVDVLLVAHVGFDAVTTFNDMWNGALVRACGARMLPACALRRCPAHPRGPHTLARRAVDLGGRVDRSAARASGDLKRCPRLSPRPGPLCSPRKAGRECGRCLRRCGRRCWPGARSSASGPATSSRPTRSSTTPAPVSRSAAMARG